MEEATGDPDCDAGASVQLHRVLSRVREVRPPVVLPLRDPGVRSLRVRPVVVGRLFFFRGRSKRAKAARGGARPRCSSLMMDVAWGVAGLAVPLVGLAADRVGLQAVLTGMALLPC